MQILSVGAGIRWPDVYSFLEPLELIVISSRLGDVDYRSSPEVQAKYIESIVNFAQYAS